MVEVGDIVWIRDGAYRQYNVVKVLRYGIDSDMNPYMDYLAFWDGMEYRITGDWQGHTMPFAEWNPARKNPHFVTLDELDNPPVLSIVDKDRLSRAMDPTRVRTDENLRKVFGRS